MTLPPRASHMRLVRCHVCGMSCESDRAGTDEPFELPQLQSMFNSSNLAKTHTAHVRWGGIDGSLYWRTRW